MLGSALPLRNPLLYLFQFQWRKTLVAVASSMLKRQGGSSTNSLWSSIVMFLACEFFSMIIDQQIKVIGAVYAKSFGVSASQEIVMLIPWLHQWLQTCSQDVLPCRRYGMIRCRSKGRLCSIQMVFRLERIPAWNGRNRNMPCLLAAVEYESRVLAGIEAFRKLMSLVRDAETDAPEVSFLIGSWWLLYLLQNFQANAARW